MKKIISTIIVFALIANVSAQFKLDSSGKIGIGAVPSTALLRLYDSTFPFIQLEGPNSRLELAIATSNGFFSNYAEPGDAVIRPLGGNNRLLFYIPNSYNNGNSFIKFGDAHNGGWISIFNNRKMYIDGNLGIGRSPSYKLDVDGTVRVELQVISSDERLKTEIKSLSDEKDKLFLLNGKSYKKTPRPSGIKEVRYTEDGVELPAEEREIIELQEYGYLAQELIKVFPDLVSQDDDGYHGINYIGLIPVIVEAMKDQKLIIEKQQRQIEELQAAVFSGAFRSSTDLTGTGGIGNATADCKLYQNAPNPFNQNTQIRYYIPQTVISAQLCIYDLQGKQIKQIQITQRGDGFQIISGSELTAGMYLYSLIVDGNEVDTKRMILTK